MLARGKPAKGARAYLFIGPSTRISPVVLAPDECPHARPEITIGPITTFARETPEEMVRAPCVERGDRFSRRVINDCLGNHRQRVRQYSAEASMSPFYGQAWQLTA